MYIYVNTKYIFLSFYHGLMHDVIIVSQLCLKCESSSCPFQLEEGPSSCDCEVFAKIRLRSTIDITSSHIT